MATITATRAAAGQPVFSPIGSGNLAVAYGSYDIATNPTAADVIELCRLPKGAVVVGGFVRIEDIDTNGVPTLDIDIGWAGNGTEAADADGFGNLGVRNGDVVANYLPEGGSLLPLNGTLKDGFVSFSAETVVQATVVAAAATFAAGTISVVVYYVIP